MNEELPVLNSNEAEADSRPSASPANSRKYAVHALRVSLFLCIVLMIRMAHSRATNPSLRMPLLPLASIETLAADIFDEPITLEHSEHDPNVVIVNSAKQKQLGYLIQTSPDSDDIIGYSGPTNCLIAIDQNDKICGVKILSSADTIEHVDLVQAEKSFFDAFLGLGFGHQNWQELDAVSGATLTSYAIIAGVANRTGGSAPALKFSPQPKLASVKKLFPTAEAIRPTDRPTLWQVIGPPEKLLGTVATTSPVADHLSGYQGPTATLIGMNTEDICVGLAVDQTYENEPYAFYLDDDYSFLGFYQGKTWDELAKLIPEENGIDGVSGATMTTQTVAQAIPMVAQKILAPPVINLENSTLTRRWSTYWADAVTILLVLWGLVFSWTKLAKRRWLRLTYQLLVIVMLGFLSGHMLSQASLAGWSANGIPWRIAPGLAFLSMAAVLVPVFSKHQTYCQHVCPFGAIQQLGKNRLPWKVKLSARVRRCLSTIPFVLLGLVVVVAITGTRFNLASIEPFDGFSFRVAGWATIGIFVVGLIFSLVSPMAYCRFGCPTGAMLNYLRFRSNSHQLGVQDACALALALTGILFLLNR